VLASLLPGLRDIRTPLTVGYLWLLIAWLLFGEHVPKSRPSGNGLLAQLFDLSGILGKAAPIAALSFIAYLLGALLTIPVESRFISSILSILGTFSQDTRLTTEEYARWRAGRTDEVRDRIEVSKNRNAGPVLDISDSEMRTLVRFAVEEPGSYLAANDLRARLLVANQQMYGEYDRLAAEASFRVNMFLPLIALGLLVVFDFNRLLGFGIMAGAAILLVQGAIRLNLSNTVLRRAVLANVIKDPLTEKIEEILGRAK
jgi:hypothetical protein